MARHDLRRVRTFIAVELSGGVKHRAQELIKKLKQAPAEVKWVDPKTLHLTLKFLGDVGRDEILPICKIAREVAQQFQPFDLQFGNLGAFPDFDRPRAMWLGVQEGLEELKALQKALDLALHKEMNFAKERRQFTPHLTIGRVHQHSPELREMMEGLADFSADFSSVDEMVVFATFTEKEGTRHEALGHAALGESATKPVADDEDDDFEDENDEDFDDDEDLEDEFDEDEEE